MRDQQTAFDTEAQKNHITWLQRNAANAAHTARENLRALFVSGPNSEWFVRAKHDQDFSASQYAEARRLLGIDA